jgi:hypothetical protein
MPEPLLFAVVRSLRRTLIRSEKQPLNWVNNDEQQREQPERRTTANNAARTGREENDHE